MDLKALAGIDRRGRGKVVMGFDHGDLGLLNRVLVTPDNPGADERIIGGQGFGAEGIEVSTWFRACQIGCSTL